MPILKDIVRIDRGELMKPERLPNGWMRVEGYIGRTGLLEYPKADGTTWVEYRPPEEAFRADVLDSFASVPLTNDHPAAGILDASNTAQYQRGTVERPVRDGDRHRARILATDSAVIADMEAGKVELSCGYLCDLDMTPGEIDGKHYDAIQRNIRGNHVAIVHQARAGHAFRVRMDSAAGELVAFPPGPIRRESAPFSVSPKGNAQMKKIHIDGVDYEVSEVVAQAFEKSRAAGEAALKAAKDAEQKANAKADAAEAEIKKLKADAAEAPAKIRAEIKARVELETKAAEILGEEKFDGKTDMQIKRAVAEKTLGLKLDGKADAYVEASFDLALQKHAEGSENEEHEDGDDEPETAPIERADGGASLEKAQRDYFETLRTGVQLKVQQ